MITFDVLLQRNLNPELREQQDIAAQKFLQLLMYLKAVFLQDLALLIDLQPHVPLWTDDAIKQIITHPKWAAFKAHVQLTHSHISDDDIHDFTQVGNYDFIQMPNVNNYLTSL